jgi:hypothetical protein
MYEKIKGELKQIVELVELLPERYRDKCFDLLLSSLLVGKEPSTSEKEDPSKKADESQTKKDKGFTFPAKVKAFIRRYGIKEEQLERIAMVESGDVHFIHEPKDVKNATGQIHWALLLGLKSALLGGEMIVDPEGVRSICIEKGLYDKANFAANFKRAPNRSLFNGLLEPQGESRKLTSKGEEKLAEVLNALAG